MHRNRLVLTAAVVALASASLVVPASAAGALGVLSGCGALDPSSLPVSADAAERWIDHARERCTLPASADAAEHWLLGA